MKGEHGRRGGAPEKDGGNELSRRRKMPSAVDSTGLQDTPFLSLLSSVEIKSEKVKSRAWTRE